MTKKELIKEIQAIDHLEIFKWSYYSWGITSPFEKNKDTWLDVKQLRQFKKTIKEIYKNLPLFLSQFKKIDQGYCSLGGSYEVFYNEDHDLKFYDFEDREYKNTIGVIKKHIKNDHPVKNYYSIDVVRSQIQYKNARLIELSSFNLEKRKTLAYAGGGGYDKVAHVLYSFIKKNRLNFNNINDLLDKIDKGYYTNLNQSINVDKFNEVLKEYLIEGSEMRIFKSEIKGSGEFFKCNFYTSFKYPSI